MEYGFRESDSPVIGSVWRATLTEDGRYVDAVNEFWGLAFGRLPDDRPTATLIGPSLEPRTLELRRGERSLSSGEIGVDHVLANASLLWLTGSVRSSMRLYSEPAGAWDEASWAPETADTPEAADEPAGWPYEPCAVPTAFALFPDDLTMAPRELAERHFAVERFSVLADGGHFAALKRPDDLERPDDLTEDLMAFLDGRR